MALEAINNAMGVQATGYVAPVKQATPTDKADINPVEIDQHEMVDATTNVVVDADNKGDANYEGNGQNTYQQATTSNEQLKKAVEQFNSSVSNSNSEAIYGIHEGTNRVTIKIVDKSTKKVIKELPPEKTLDMIARVWEMAGILIDEKR